MRFKTQSIIHYFGAQPSLLLYGLAVLAVAIAASVTHFIQVIGERAAFLVFFSQLFRPLSGSDGIRDFSR